jgi:hypothetical protein
MADIQPVGVTGKDRKELAPCPFCGMVPEFGPLFVSERNGNNVTTIECVNPNCAIQPYVQRFGNDVRAHGHTSHYEAAVAAWNWRP